MSSVTDNFAEVVNACTSKATNAILWHAAIRENPGIPLPSNFQATPTPNIDYTSCHAKPIWSTYYKAATPLTPNTLHNPSSCSATTGCKQTQTLQSTIRSAPRLAHFNSLSVALATQPTTGTEWIVYRSDADSQMVVRPMTTYSAMVPLF